ncbi:hypothetical protein GWI33_006338 [Rhynchophorus ferrugineus]|uniref:Uncharacterized protein n=1 Tax=Rhynchophorus ferrugineus TaxID=354439 RepID=A0A834IJ76_RHYFE|nr:hypothetical protein GWI33_006338 [Rhynchophorus ferrugineus]
MSVGTRTSARVINSFAVVPLRTPRERGGSKVDRFWPTRTATRKKTPETSGLDRNWFGVGAEVKKMEREL